jgi:WD40 repeat protein
VPNSIPDAPTNAGTAKLVVSLKGHTGAIEKLVFSPDRNLLVSSSNDGTCRVWEIGGKPSERSVVRKSGDGIRALAFSSNSRSLAVGSANGLVSLVDASSKPATELRVLRGGQVSINALAFSSDGKSLAGGGDDNTLRIWEPAASPGGEPRIVLPGHTRPISSVAYSPEGQIVVTASRDSSVRVWALNWIRPSQKTSLSLGGEIEAVAYSLDGKLLATAVPGKAIQVWDVAGAKPLAQKEYPAPNGGVRCLQIPESDTLICVGGAGALVNYSLRSGRERQKWELPSATATSFALTGDGRYLARGLEDGMVEVFRVAEKRK